MTEQLSRLNRLVYRAERAFVASALLVMALVVFLDVAHRTFSGERSKGLEAFIKVIGWFGPDLGEGTAAHASALAVLPWVAFALFAALMWAAARAATRGAMPHARAALVAFGGTALVYGMVLVLVRLLPNGLIWSQPMALVLTLWVGFFGASMATYEHKHLRVEAVIRKVPPHLRKYVDLLSSTVTALFCFAMTWVAIRYVRFSYEEYVSTGGQGGVLVGLDIPKYAAFMALPLAFGIMTARFAGVGVLAYQGRLVEADPLDGLVDEKTKQALAVAVGDASQAGDDRPPSDVRASSDVRAPSDVPTEAIRPFRDDDLRDLDPSPRTRAAAAVGDIVTSRPSDVVTDRHGVADDDETDVPTGPDGGAR